jgi:hypothetical protein
MAGERTVALTESTAARMAAATLAYERGNRDQSAIHFRQGGDDGEPVRLGKTTAAWSKGTIATIALHENGTPPSETTSSASLENCVNKFANVASGKWVIVARGLNGYWYLIAAECL